MVAWWGPVLGPLWGGYSPPLWPASCYPRDGASAPEAFRPRPTGGWLTRSAGLRLCVHNAMRLTACPETDFSLRAYHRLSKRIGARLKRYVHVWLGMAFWRVRFKNTVSVFFLRTG